MILPPPVGIIARASACMHKNGPLRVGVNYPVPTRFGGVQGGGVLADAGIVDCNVKAIPAGHYILDESINL